MDEHNTDSHVAQDSMNQEETMNIQSKLMAFIVLGIIFSPHVLASDEEVTMTVVEETQDEIVSTIALPEGAAEQARESAAAGIETANRAREDGREFGAQQSAAARESGREMGERMAQEARDGNVAEQARESAQDRRPERPEPPQRGRP